VTKEERELTRIERGEFKEDFKNIEPCVKLILATAFNHPDKVPQNRDTARERESIEKFAKLARKDEGEFKAFCNTVFKMVRNIMQELEQNDNLQKCGINK